MVLKNSHISWGIRLSMWTGVLALPIGALQAQAVVQGIDGVAGLIGKAGAAAGKVLSQYGEARKKVAEGQRELNNQNGNPTVSGATPNPGGSVPQYIFQGPPGVTVPPGSPNPQMGQPGVYVTSSPGYNVAQGQQNPPTVPPQPSSVGHPGYPYITQPGQPGVSVPPSPGSNGAQWQQNPTTVPPQPSSVGHPGYPYITQPGQPGVLVTPSPGYNGAPSNQHIIGGEKKVIAADGQEWGVQVLPNNKHPVPQGQANPTGQVSYPYNSPPPNVSGLTWNTRTGQWMH